jgi:hypothetical protein
LQRIGELDLVVLGAGDDVHDGLGASVCRQADELLPVRRPALAQVLLGERRNLGERLRVAHSDVRQNLTV